MSRDFGPFRLQDLLPTLDEAGRVSLLRVHETFWQELEAGVHGDFAGGRRLVSFFTFTENWPTWERHPAGEELVLLLAGNAEFVLQLPEGERVIHFTEAGSYVVVPRGVWHTAKVPASATMLFITPGESTENRPL